MSIIAQLQLLLKLPGFRRLFLVRLLSQCADGLIQVGLASLLFFSPQSMGTAAGVAAGFAVLLAPFTLIGPFIGILLDRWRRRNVLVKANLFRGGVTLVMALSLGAFGGVGLVALLGLIALSINRFLLAALSAGLPTVLAADAPGRDEELLLVSNSIVPTLGTVSTFIGVGLGFLLGVAMPTQQIQDVAALICAALMMFLASAAAFRLAPGQLGPSELATTPFSASIKIILHDLRAGADYLRARVTPGQGLLAMATSRFLYGITFISAILISRNLLATPGDMTAGMANFGVILGLSAVGFGLAVLITPVFARRTGQQVWVSIMLLLGTISQLIIAIAPSRPIIYLNAILLGISTQAAKIAVDTIVQRDTADSFRGRAFAFYDVLFNGAFVAAALLGAFIVPDAGWNRPLFLALAFGYLIASLLVLFRAARWPREVSQLASGR